MRSELVFCQRLSEVLEGPSPGRVLVRDRAVPLPDGWTTRFGLDVPVAAGEGLKQWESARALLDRLAAFPSLSRRSGVLVALGGGSVTATVGFLASVWERGVALELIPSTWLAALDSAHGGKTALNLSGDFEIKNRVGTFYPASRVHLVRDLLMGQPRELAASAWNELVKVAWIDGGEWGRRLGTTGALELWNHLPDAIQAKLRVVEQDPFDRHPSGLRNLLNLGHTLGHAWELQCRLDHGSAVGLGLRGAALWALERGRVAAETADRLLEMLGPRPAVPRLELGAVEHAVSRDKKRNAVGEILEPILEEAGDRPLGVRVVNAWVRPEDIVCAAKCVIGALA